jgi:hypothetical protein
VRLQRRHVRVTEGANGQVNELDAEERSVRW